MDYDRLTAELALPAYDGMSDAEIAAALIAETVETAGSSMITPSDFVARFTPVETAALLDSLDPVVRQLLLRLRTQQEPIDLAKQTVAAGLAYLAGMDVPGLGAMKAPLITVDRIPEIAAVPPGPATSRCRLIDCPELAEMDDRSKLITLKHAREKGA